MSAIPLGRISRHRRSAAPSEVPTLWTGGRHLALGGTRAGLLFLCDVIVMWELAGVLKALRTGPWLSPGAAETLDLLVPYGHLLQAAFPLNVVFCLALLGTYGGVGAGRTKGRRITAGALAVTLPAWAALWQEPSSALLAGYALLSLVVILALLLSTRCADAVRQVMTPHRYRAARVLLVASEHDLHRVNRHPALSDRKMFTVRGVFDPEELSARGALEEFCAAIRRHDADTVVLCCGPLGDRAFSVVTDAATTLGCALVSLTRSPRSAGSGPHLVWAHGSPLMVLATPGKRILQLLLKRAGDIVVSGVTLIILSPLMAFIALCIRFESSGPVLFRQRRIGAWDQSFGCLKFRTMRVDAEQLLRNDPALNAKYVQNNYKLPDGEDPRITRVGRILRKTSLDELPQLWNVFRGDMSLIGPRPVVPEELNEYGEKRRVLLSVKPGMSGAWAVTGRSSVGYPHRAAIELHYVRRWRLLRDLSILFRTLPAVIARRGAH
jgi:exopolysaccharide production protein ExoY